MEAVDDAPVFANVPSSVAVLQKKVKTFKLKLRDVDTAPETLSMDYDVTDESFGEVKNCETQAANSQDMIYTCEFHAKEKIGRTQLQVTLKQNDANITSKTINFNVQEDKTIQEAQAACTRARNQNRLTSKVSTISFDGNSGCQFGSNGNSNRLNGHYQARYEESALYHLPDDLDVFCGIDFRFNQSNFTYNDEIVLTLNNFIVLSSSHFNDPERALPGESGPHPPSLEEDDGVMIFDWNRLKGSKSAEAFHYCLGIDKNDNSYDFDCVIPESVPKDQGADNVIDSELFVKIPNDQAVKLAGKAGLLLDKTSQENSIEDPVIKIIATGDDDQSDCSVDALDFQIELIYIAK